MCGIYYFLLSSKLPFYNNKKLPIIDHPTIDHDFGNFVKPQNHWILKTLLYYKYYQSRKTGEKSKNQLLLLENKPIQDQY